jgi:large subunit ribosomal protein L18
MKNVQQQKRKRYIRRVIRTRSRITGSAERPRASIFRSDRHVSIQLIDDSSGKTLCAASDRELKKATKMKKSDVAQAVGELIADKAVKMNITRVIFDRRGYQYHGRVKALADGMRAKGLVF